MQSIPYYASLIFIFTIPWHTIAEHPVLGSLGRIIGYIAAGVWIIYVIATRQFRRPHIFHYLFFLFVSWCAASILWSDAARISAPHVFTWMQLFLMTLMLWDLYPTNKEVKTGLLMYVLGCYVIVINTIYNFQYGVQFYYERFTATGVHPDDLGLILAIGIPAAWYLASSKSNTLFRWINLTYLPASLAAIALSGTRTAIVALVPAIVYMSSSLFHMKIRYSIIALCVVISAIIAVFPYIPPSSVQRLTGTWAELTTGDMSGRVDIWRQGLDAFERHPVIGVAADMFRSVNRENKVAHNSFLSVLVELGLVGLLLFSSILIVAVRSVFKLPSSEMMFWISIFLSLIIGANALTWEYHKVTWMVLILMLCSVQSHFESDEIESSIALR